jgi:predicted PurR-regulated permease PerM
MKLTSETKKGILSLVAITLAMVWVMQRLDFIPRFLSSFFSFFSPLFIGAFIAFVVNLPMRSLENLLFSKKWKRGDKIRQKIRRPISMILAFLIFFGIIGSIIFLVLPDLVNTIISFGNKLPGTIKDFQDWVAKLDTNDSDFVKWLQTSSFSVNNLIQRGINWLNQATTDMASSAFVWLSSVLNRFFNTFLGLVFAIYFLLRKESIGRNMRELNYAAFPERIVDRLVQFFSLVNRVFSRFIGGSVQEALILGTLNFIGMKIFGFPYALTISVMIAVGQLIPIFGALIFGAFGTLFIFVESPIQGLAYLLMLLIIQQLEGNFIYPRVVGKSVGLPSLLVFFAVTFGSKAFGFVGLLLAVPAFSVFYVLIRSWSSDRVRKKGIDENKILYGMEEADADQVMGISREEPATSKGQAAREDDRQEKTPSTDEEKNGSTKEEEKKPPKAILPFDLDKLERELDMQEQEADQIKKEAWDTTKRFLHIRRVDEDSSADDEEEDDSNPDQDSKK